MTYRCVSTRKWNDDKYPFLSEDAQRLFDFLITSPRGHSLGYYVQSKQDIAASLRSKENPNGWTMKRFGKPFAELLLEQLIKYDEIHRIVYLPNALKYNTIENPNQVKAATRHLRDIPINHEYYRQLKQFLEQLGKPFLEPLLELLRNGLANQEPRTKNQDKKEISCSSSDERDNDFASFWQAYPRKKGKGGARKAWEKARKKTSPGRILEALEKQRPQWQDKKFIPYPATWLNQERWEDEVEVQKRFDEE